MELIEKITFIIGILTAIIFALTLTTKKNSKRKNNILLGIICICLIGGKIISASQYSIKFDSPESAYMYMYFERNPVVIEGRETAYVEGKSNFVVLLKEGDKWRIPESLLSISKCYKKLGTTEIYAKQYTTSEEYYVWATDFSGAQLEVADNRNSHFYRTVSENRILDTKRYIYRAYVNELDEEYTIIINGKEIQLIE